MAFRKNLDRTPPIVLIKSAYLAFNLGITFFGQIKFNECAGCVYLLHIFQQETYDLELAVCLTWETYGMTHW